MSTNTRSPIYLWVRSLFHALPPATQERLRRLRIKLDRFNPSPTARWIRNVYSEFGRAQRRSIFLEIARFAHINRPIHGYYFEFGSHEANTMRMAWDTFRHLFDWTFVAFDSFEGLPEITAIDEQEIWRKGKLKTGEEQFMDICRRHGIPEERLMTVKGFYDQTLNADTKRRLQSRRAAVVYVDCDLYESTVPVLEFIKDFLQRGTVVVFDDWNCFWADPDKGERRAWREFRERYPELRFEEFAATGMQKAFVFVGPETTRGEPGSGKVKS